ncbi:unnamed protein product [Clonostachys byssicola]|uniref:NAD(P)-binding domain-containing protein n=1 Tax=Clonostachys byssicola TaxID=160290 RepID=A0A9N9Y2M0_9HYPO|nr:unnamed protein product [Clonostachys byssicola]
MPGKILVLGGTGPAGICLLRELLFRDHDVIAFARNPSKIPDDLKSNPKLEVVKGELTDREQLADAVSRSSAVLSLLGPNSLLNTDPEVYYNFYVLLFGLMREHQVRRVFAMSTISVWQPGDHFSLIRWLLVALVFVVAHYGWRTARAIARVFEEHAGGLDWTVYRIGGIPGGSDEESWRADREDHETYEGTIGAPGWSPQQRRAALARWLVDAVEDGKQEWVRKMPAITALAGRAKLR